MRRSTGAALSLGAIALVFASGCSSNDDAHEALGSDASALGGHDATTEETRDGGTGGDDRSDGGPFDPNDPDGAMTEDADLPGWKLAWSDEFNGAALDTTIWNATPDGHGGYNQELQYFNGPGTTSVSGGSLHIAALTIGAPGDGAGDAGLTCWYGPCKYSSAQLDTIGKFSHQYGRFAARIKIPAGGSFWPAFWMLANTGGWPAGGEIDVMENVGPTPTTVYGTIHGPDMNGSAYAKGGTYNFPGGDLSGDYHVYAIEWTATQIQWFLDDQLYFTVTPADLASGDKWVWDEQPFYLLLDLAIGGDWPGDPDGGIPEPSEMLVDWVRVYDPE